MIRPVDDVLIAGSGYAAWATAATLVRATGGRVRVRVVAAGPCDAPLDELMGSCRPEMLAANAALGIDEAAFMRATSATFKLGTEYRDWSVPGESYLDVFGDIGARFDSVAFHQLVNRVRLAGGQVPRLDECSLAAVAARADRFAHPTADRKSVMSTYSYACHFDVPAATRLLQSVAERGGAQALAGHIGDVIVGEDGFVRGVTLGGGERIEAQFFIDCSGPESRLLGQALKVPFESWNQSLPCDRVMWARTPGGDAPATVTRATAGASGWRLDIPLQSGDVRAFFFASGHLAADQALRELQGDDAGAFEPRTAAFLNGRRRRLWLGNCVAIGSAAGEIEPLVSTSLQLIERAIARLIRLFPHEDCGAGVAQEFERVTIAEYDCARDLALVHYCASRRNDSSYWREIRAAGLPESLQYRMALFQRTGRLARFEDEIFEEPDWVRNFIGLGLWPELADPLAQGMDVSQIARRINRVREIVEQAARAMPAHRRYLEARGLAVPVVDLST